MSGLLGGVLPAIYSQADRAKRYLGGLLSDPIGRMEQSAGQAQADLSKLGLLSEQAFSDPRNPMKLQDNAAARQLVDTYLNSVMNFAPVGMFVGPKSATWDKAASERAQALAQKGVDPRQIWKETGTFKGPDGMWRQEIDDSASYIKGKDGTVLDALRYGNTPDKVMFHPKLEKAYQMDNVRIGSPDGMSSRGSMSVVEEKHTLDDLLNVADPLSVQPKRVSEINVSRTAPDQRSTLLHEIQHDIQQREGWALGGSTDAAPLYTKRAMDDALSANYRAKENYGLLSDRAGEISMAKYLKGLKELSVKPNLKPSAITNLSPWYEYSDDIRALYGPMPKKAGAARDTWLNNAADRMYFRESQKWDLPEYKSRGLLERDTKDMKRELEQINRQRAQWVDGSRQYHQDKAKFDRLLEMSDFDQYQRLMGEAEARATQARMNMNMQQRREVFPLDSYDVPLDQLILRR